MQNIQNGRSCFRYNSAVYLFCPFRFIFIHFFIGTWSLLLTISVGYLLCSLYIFCTVPRGEKRSFFLSPKQCFSFAEVGSVIVRLCSPSGAAPLLLSAHQIPKKAKKNRFGQKLPNLFRFCKKVCIFCAGCTTDLIAKKVLQTYILRLRPVFRRYFSTSCFGAVKSA